MFVSNPGLFLLFKILLPRFFFFLCFEHQTNTETHKNQQIEPRKNMAETNPTPAEIRAKVKKEQEETLITTKQEHEKAVEDKKKFEEEHPKPEDPRKSAKPTPLKGSISIFVEKGKGLLACDVGGTSDPFLVISMKDKVFVLFCFVLFCFVLFCFVLFGFFFLFLIFLFFFLQNDKALESVKSQVVKKVSATSPPHLSSFSSFFSFSFPSLITLHYSLSLTHVPLS